MTKKYIFQFLLQLALLTNCIAAEEETVMKLDSILDYIVRESRNSKTKSPMLILLHGHGSNENDLFYLGEKIPTNWHVVSIRGPYQLAKNSYRWYDVKMVNGKITINIEQEEESKKKLLHLINHLIKKYNVDASKIVVAGFSQGANMAQALGLSEPGLVSKFGVFSGRFVEEFIPYINNSLGLKNSKAFIAYGSNDKMLPKAYVDDHVTKLKNLDIQITYCEDTNGHSISMKQWNEFISWLNKLD